MIFMMKTLTLLVQYTLNVKVCLNYAGAFE